MTSLDELLDRGVDEPARRAPAGRVVWWVLKAAAGAAVVSGALVLALYALGRTAPYPLVFAGVFALLVVHRAVAGLEVVRSPGTRAGPEPEPDPADGLRRVVRQWQAHFTWEKAGLRRPGRTLQPTLAELVDERLRQRRGITRASNPVRARALLGERLWSYLADPKARMPPPADLADIVSDVEKI